MRIEPCQREDISCRQHRLPLCQAAGTGRHHRWGVYRLASGQDETSDLSTGFHGTETSAASIAKSFYFVMWAYGGWNNINNITEEVKNPKRNIPLASVFSVFAVTIIYLLTIVSYLAVMSRQDMLASSTVAMTWGTKVLGGGVASLLISLSVMASTAGSGNAGIFTSPRIMFSAARDGNLPDVLSYIHVTRRTPIAAILFMVILGILCCLVADIVTLISFSSLLDWFFYFLCAVALLVIRFRQRGKDDDVAYKQPVLVPVLFMVVCLYLVVVPQLDGLTLDLLFSFVLLMVGVGLYLMFRFFKNRSHICDGLVIFIQLLMRVGPPASYDASR
ncbi:b(0,+)-type amino acid transporter 1-like [Pomacea canaliculata]|uniref:b(0,+)-type amino acid transporter 1-like n=1 Tax=Pomacea canaliculata TaxID=400727 RepID=UPI000D72BD07|nr:b(0,+)-type amino acid transporter 1-like [Pomacea canaliculata]